MKHSCVTLRGTKFVPLRPEFVRICDDNPCAALLLAVFDFATAARQNEAVEREAHGDDPHPMGSWIRASYPYLGLKLGGAFKERAIRSGLDIIIGKGFVMKQANPERKLDRALWYRLNVVAVNRAIEVTEFDGDAAQDSIPANAGMDDAERTDHAGARSDGETKERETSPVDEVWSYYVEVFNATRQVLDSTRKTIIRNALKVRTIEECKRAIDGLSVSPWHNGDNPQRKKYLGIRYALSGNERTKKSADEVIDDMIDLADEHGGVIRGGKLPTDHPRIKRWLENVRYALRNRAELTRGREALNALREHGYDVAKLEQAPWVRLIPYEQPRQAA
jgi:hypothetical protein